MNQEIVKKISERKQRWVEFYKKDGKISRMNFVRFDDGMPLDKRPRMVPENKQKRIEWAWEKYQCQLKQAEWLDDDYIPSLDVYTATEIFAEAFGCKVHRSPDDIPFALSLIQNASEVSKIKIPDIYTPNLKLLFEIADELRSRAGKDAVFKLIDIQSPMDISALIWDKTKFFMAMCDSPEAVKELSSKVKQFLIIFFDEWSKRYGREFVSHCPDYYIPYGITLSEDEIGSVNEEMFLEFFLPELTELSNRYGMIGMHCCANAKHQWNNLLKIPNLSMLQIVQPYDRIIEAHSFFAGKVPLMTGLLNGIDWPENVPKDAHFILEYIADSKEKAVEVANKLRNIQKA